MSKLKKFLLLIPTAFIMLLNCMSFTAFAEDEETDFPVFLDPADYTPYDFTDVDTVLSGYSSSFDPSESYYFYCAYFTPEEYDNFINNRKSSLTFLFFTFDLDFFSIENDSVYEAKYNLLSKFSFNYDPTNSQFDPFLRITGGSSLRFDYCKDNGSIQYSSDGYYSKPSTLTREPFTNNLYFIYQATNLPNLELHENAINSGSCALNVEVAFKPTLSGEVDRSFTRDGVEYLSTNFSLHVNNKSKFPIQYTMDIRPVDSYTDFVFRYYENDWVYAPKLDSAGDFWNQVPQKQQKSTNCHYVSSGSLDSVVFNYNQVNLVEGIEYVVEVYAARNDYGCASELVVSSVEEVYPELYQVQNTLVYQSQFSMKQYSDVKYDPTNTSNGVLPYDFELGQKYEHSYNAVEKEDGEVDYTGKDVYSDKDSWYHKPIDDNTQGGSFSSSTTSSNGFSNFAKSFQNFFGFIRYMFNFFPKDAKTIFTIGFSAITIIALVKVLFKS